MLCSAQPRIEVLSSNGRRPWTAPCLQEKSKTEALRPITFKVLDRFFRRKQSLDLGDIPMFYQLLASGRAEQKADRLVMLRLLRASVVDASDIEPTRRRYVWELVMSLASTPSMSQLSVRVSAIRVVCAAVTTVPELGRELVSRMGLGPWLVSTALEFLEVHVAGGLGARDSVASALAADCLRALVDLLETRGFPPVVARSVDQSLRRLQVLALGRSPLSLEGQLQAPSAVGRLVRRALALGSF